MPSLDLFLPIPERLNPDGARINVLGTWDAPWFCLNETCAFLGIANVANVAARLKDAEKINIRRVDVGGPSGGRPFTYVSEAAFYKVVLRSDKPRAEPLADWVAGEVLPSIRKYGCYPPPANPKPDLLPYTHRVLAAGLLEHSLPAGYWCVFTEASSLLILAEQVFVPAGLRLDPDDLLDGSAGTWWRRFRKDKPWAGEPIRYDYRFPPPSKRCRIVVHPLAYLLSELPCFRDWMRNQYVPVHFVNYILTKYRDVGNQAALPHLRRLIPAAVANAS